MNSKVSLLECRSYDINLVKESLQRSFKNLGGIEKYINKGDKVLLKINLLMKKKPEEAVTTHPIFVRALCEILIDYGAKVIIGDSPGGPFRKSILSRIYQSTGMSKITEDLNVTLNYNTDSMYIKNPDAKYLKNLTVVEMLKDVDKVISVSKLKTHGMMTFTGAVKNLFGIIPGTTKAEYHFKMPNVDDFANALIDICIAAKPVLSFMDGIIGMEGAGPSAGHPRKIGAIISSSSPFHLDVVASKIIGLEYKDVPTIRQSVKRGICKGDFSDIQIIGEDINKFIIKDFVIPKYIDVSLINENFPGWLKHIMRKATESKPVFNYNKCIGCRDCAKNCPAKAIEMIDNKPKVDLNSCIRCFCCQELCPQKAIKVKKTAFMKLLQKL